jgi:hypothetical protein
MIGLIAFEIQVASGWLQSSWGYGGGSTGLIALAYSTPALRLGFEGCVRKEVLNPGFAGDGSECEANERFSLLRQKPPAPPSPMLLT